MIEKIFIRGFGKYMNFEMTFRPGLNLLYGMNESGKTTLMRFIQCMFFGMKKNNVRRKIYTKEYYQYKPWHHEEYGGVMIYSLDQERYRIERNFSREDDWIRVYLENTGEEITSRFPLDERKELLILPSQIGLTESLFQNTICIHSLSTKIDDSSNNASLARDINERIINLLTTQQDDVSIKNALGLIQKALQEIGTEKSRAKPYGAIKERLDQYQLDMAQYEELLDMLLAKGKAKKDLEEDLSTLHKKEKEIGCRIYSIIISIIKAKNEEVNKLYDSLNMLAERYQKLHKAFDGITEEAFREIMKDFNDYRSELNELKQRKRWVEKYRSELTLLFKEMNLLRGIEEAAVTEEEVSEIEEELARAHETVVLSNFDQFDNEKARLLKSRKKKIYMMAFLGIVFLASIGTGFMIHPWIWLFSLFCLLLGGGFWKHVQKDSRYIARINEQIEGQEKLFHELESKRSMMEERIRRITQKTGYSDFAAFLGDFRKFSRISKQINEYENLIHDNEEWIHEKVGGIQDFQREIKAFFESLGEPLESAKVLDPVSLQLLYQRYHEYVSIPVQIQDIKEKKVSLENEIDDLYRESTEWEGYADGWENGLTTDLQVMRRLKNEYAHIKKCKYEKETEMAVLSAKLKDLEERLDHFVNVESDYLQAQGELERLLALKRGLEEASVGLQEISDEYQKDFVPVITKRMQIYLQHLTNGRYRDIKFDTELHFKAQGTDNPHLVDVDSLSNGTVDQIFLAFRVAASEYLTGREKLFYLMDDPFVQYDPNRRRNAIRTILHLAKRHQILLFTCHDEIRKDLDAVQGHYHYYELS